MENEMVLTFDCNSNTKFNSSKEAIDELCRKIQENYEKNSNKGFITEEELLEGTFLAKQYPDFGWTRGIVVGKE